MEPAEKEDLATKANTMRFETGYKVYSLVELEYQNKCEISFSIIWQKWSDLMRLKLKMAINWNMIYIEKSIFDIIKNINVLFYRYECHTQTTMELLQEKTRAYTLYKG